MANTISFSIQNPHSIPANQPDLYLGQANQLNFLFSNTLGIPSVNPGDVFTINIPDNLISSASADQLLSKNWKVQQVTHQTSAYSYSLTPLTQLDFSGTITISLQKLTGLTATNGDVSCDFTVSGDPISGPSEKLIVSAAPSDKSKRLLDFITIANPPFINSEQQEIVRGSVYTSPTAINKEGKEQLAPPIANQIHLNLKFNGSQLVDTPWKGTPRFMFSFSYGSQGSDLTDAIKSGQPNYNPLTSAWNITARIGDDQTDQWILSPLNNDSSTPVWVVQPTENNPYLFTNTAPNLDIIFDHVISVLAPDNASVYIQWANIPGYNPDSKVLDLPKQVPNNKIINFTSKSLNFYSEDLVVLDWQTFATDKVQLSWTNTGKNSKSDEIIIPAYPNDSSPALVYSGSNKGTIDRNFPPPFLATDQTYTCRLMIPGDEPSQKEQAFSLIGAKPPVISSFNVEVLEHPNGVTLTLSWAVQTDIAIAYCVLDGVEGFFNLKDSHSIELKKQQAFPKQFTLRVKGFLPEVTSVLNQSLKVIETISGFQVMARHPITNRLFMINNDNLIFYCNAINIPDKITSSITIGGPPKANTKLYLSPNGKKAFAINSGYPTDNSKIYYFDPANPPAVATDTIESMNAPFFVFFLPDSTRTFITSFGSDSRIAFFDSDNPPKTIDPQINTPGPATDGSSNLSFSLDGKTAFWTKVALDISVNKSYYFDPINPPSTLAKANEIWTDNVISSFVFSPDNKVVFINQDSASRVAYFQQDNIPAQPETFVSCESPGNILFSPKGNLVFIVFNDGFNDLVVGYFDWSKPPDKVTTIVKLNFCINTGDLVLNPSQDTIYVTDYTNNILYYFDAIEPPDSPNSIKVDESPGAIFFSLNGSRIFVNNLAVNTISVLEVCYVTN